MIKGVKHTYQGMNQDVTKSKFPNEYYFEGRNIRIVATNSQSTGSITNEKGNSKILKIPTPLINLIDSRIEYDNGNDMILPFTTEEIDDTYPVSGDQKIIGHGMVRGNFVLFTTDDNGIDCIWKLNEKTYEITLLYLRNLGFSSQNPIQVISNYENEIIDKVYWVDGKAQTRFINIHHSIENQDLEELIDLSFNSIQTVGTFMVDQPEIIGTIQGGIHTAGMIQYAYNLYRINGSQTKISPLTELVPLNKGTGDGGGDVNEIVGTIPIIKIDDIDHTYTNLRLYSVKYTSYNNIPQISLILDRAITTVNEVVYYDDGNVIENVTPEEFTFLGSDIIIPKHIGTKKNRMFFANYKERNFDVKTYNTPDAIDTRAFSFPMSSSETVVYNSVYDNGGIVDTTEPVFTINTATINGATTVPYVHSVINPNYDLYNRQYSSATVGGEGAYLKYSIVRKQVGIDGFTEDDARGRFLKDNEIYRQGIQFYNRYGQVSLPKWIADFKNIVVGDQSNLNGYYATLKIELKSLFYVWLNTSSNFLDDNGIYDESLKPVGYRLLRAERTLLDRTILCQGILNGMLSQVIGDNSGEDEPDPLTPEYIAKVNGGVKIPSMMRRFDNVLCPMWLNQSYKRVDREEESHPEFDPGTFPFSINGDAANEVFRSAEEAQMSSGTYQFTQLMQMYSPEIMFNIIQNIGQTKLNVIGGLENNYNAAWEQVRVTATKLVEHEAKVYNAIYPHDTKAYLPGNFDLIQGERDNIQFHGFFGHGNEGRMNFVQTYRKYTGSYLPSDNTYDTYGSPVIADKGQGRTTYNGNSDFVFYNSLENLSADMILNFVNSFAARNISFALGANGVNTEDRKTLEGLFTDTGIVDTGAGLIAEFRISELLVYLGNIYGGNTYESKKRSNYIEIGDYTPIAVDDYTCIHAGDTFVNNFRFTKLVKTDTEVYSTNSEQLTEIVEFRVETTVDLTNRNDESLLDWDNRFQPRHDDYQKYNRVYSQDSNFIIRRDLDYKFKRVSSFDTNVIASKAKTPGEVIDSWTDILSNDVMTLDGKYGPINSLHSFKDELYTLQDSGVAFLSILPRVQTTGSDGIELELGSGQVLQDYKYISTEAGTKNKWSVVNSPQGFYFFDILNKSINRFDGKLGGVTDAKGMHVFFINNMQDVLQEDNPLVREGVSSGYDFINNDMLMTFHQAEYSFTISFNENRDAFVSFYDYLPTMYLSKGDNFIASHPDTLSLYKQYAGDHNVFFDEYYPSSVTLMVSPQEGDCVFNNIEYKSEVYLNGVDRPADTLTKVQLWNEYQDSGLRDLVVNSNISRKFRTWGITLPRNANSRDRIRNPWAFIKLQFDNENNYKLILHDATVYYTV